MNVETLTHFVRNQGKGVKGLSAMGLNTLPKQYIQPQEERISEQNVTKESIPIIDFSNPDDPEVGKSICNAAEKWGFFQLVNHSIPIHVLENVKEATYEFFGLPAEEKIKYLKENSPSNNVRLETSFVPQYESAMEWKDYLSLFFVSEEEASAIWPPACRDRVLEYMKKSDILIKNLLDVLMKGLSINKIEGNLEAQLIGTKRVNLNFYPICPNPELTVGVGRHSDVSTFTILLQDEVGGLYVRGGSGSNSWIHVNPISGSLVINIGDALQIMSNGRYKSAEHKVIANGSKDRISVPLFVNPRPSDIIGPLSEVIEKSGEEAVYKNVLYSDYVKHFYRKAHDGKSTLDFAKI